MSKELGKRIKAFREKAGLTQRSLAEKVGITIQTVSNWETGHKEPRLSVERSIRLCRALGCTLEDLAG